LQFTRKSEFRHGGNFSVTALACFRQGLDCPGVIAQKRLANSHLVICNGHSLGPWGHLVLIEDGIELLKSFLVFFLRRGIGGTFRIILAGRWLAH